MLPEPNSPVGPDEFIGRRSEIEDFREALRQGLVTGRTSSFAILGEWGIAKSSLLWKIADVRSEPTFSMLPVCLSASGDIHDYLRFAEILLDKFPEALLSPPSMHGRLCTELQDWRFKPVHFGAVGFERESPHRFLSTGTSVLRHTLRDAWDRFFRPAGLKGAMFFVDDLQNFTSISKRDLALILRNQFQWFGVEMLNFSICFSARPDFFAETKTLADPAVRFYTKLYLEPFTREEIVEYTCSVFDLTPDTSATVAAWLQEKTLGHPYFLACVSKHLSATMSRIVPQTLEQVWPAILGELGRDRFRQDLSRLSAKELDLIHQFASLGDGEFTPQDFNGKFQREYFARLADKGLLIRTRRGRYRLYHGLFREISATKQNEPEQWQTREPSAPGRGGKLAAASRPLPFLCLTHRADSIPLNPFPLTHSPYPLQFLCPWSAENVEPS